MRLSIVIPAYNEEALIGPCIEAVERSAQAAHLAQSEYEIIVVNNASTDRTHEIASSFKDVHVIDEPHKGLTRARQAGFMAAQGQLIANPDADTLMPRGWIARVLREFDKDPELAALSGPYRYYDLPLSAKVLTQIFNSFSFVAHIFNTYVLNMGATIQGGNFVLRRSALEKVGGYDTSIEFYGEDTDIGTRIAQVGKVRWIWPLYMYSSGRRLAAEGVFTIGTRYAANYLSVVFLKKPATVEYTDIREE